MAVDWDKIDMHRITSKGENYPKVNTFYIRTLIEVKQQKISKN